MFDLYIAEIKEPSTSMISIDLLVLLDFPLHILIEMLVVLIVQCGNQGTINIY